MPYDYSDQYLSQRVTDGKDASRAQTAQALAARAKAGDQAALQQLEQLSGVVGGGGWATADAQNYGRMMLRDILPGYQPSYDKAHDGGGFLSGLGHTLGSVLKIAAPIAGALIPGVGMLGAGLIGAGGSAAGGLLHGDPFNLGKTLMAGGGAALGNNLLGNGLGGGSSGLWGAAQPATGALTPGGYAGGAGGVPPYDPGMSGNPSGGGGWLGQIFGGADGKIGLGDILGGIGMIGGGISATNAQNKANQERDAAIAGATQDWQSRAPLRSAAQTGLLGLGALKAPDLSSIFADPGNPFYPRVPPLQGAA